MATSRNLGHRILAVASAVVLAACARTIPVPMSSFAPESHEPGRAIVFGSIVFELSDAGPPQERSWWESFLSPRADALESFTLFSLIFGCDPRGSECPTRDAYVLRSTPNVVSPFIVSLPPGLYRMRSVGADSGGQLTDAPIGDLAFRATADSVAYVGRVVFRIPRIIEQDVRFSYEVANSEEDDRRALSVFLERAPHASHKSLMGEGEGTTRWGRVYTPSQASAPSPTMFPTFPNQPQNSKKSKNRKGC